MIIEPFESDAERVRGLARQAGFDVAGLARVEAVPAEAGRLLEWLAAGKHGDMGYLARDPARRSDPARVLPGARTVLSVGLNYWPGELETPPERAGRVAKYALGRDYHKVFETRLKRLERDLSRAFSGMRSRRAVDHGPVLEKLWAERAGLGWRGKHTNLVSREYGSWLLLGELILDRTFLPDAAEPDHCGTCTRCITACPTGAITAPYQLDARLCISYLTIEHRGPIPEPLRPLLGDRVFGCDYCLDVCPWNRFARTAREADFRPRPGSLAPDLMELLALTEETFLERFAGTPVMRAKREGLARNAAVALGNIGGPECVPALNAALDDPSPVVREHAAWALSRSALARKLQDPNPDAATPPRS